jgi:hypothetical protein
MTDAECLKLFNREFWHRLHEMGVDSLSRLQRDALCILNFQVEVNNGGISTYLTNSSGDYARETPGVFRRIGAEEAARILEEANGFFGQQGPPVNREERMAVWHTFSMETKERIAALTKEFYKVEDRGVILADLFDAYVLSQREKSQ